VRLFHSPVRPARSRRSVLSLQCLEGREVPAGNVTAVVSPLGVLTITGDDDANDITVNVTLTGATITPNAGTTVNGGAGAATLGAFKSIKADLKGGNDVFSIDPAAGFKVTGPTSIALGDGDNTLNLVTTGKIELTALTVKGGDGVDTVTVQGGTGTNSVVAGAASFTYLNGGSTTTLTDINFGSTAKVTATEGAGVITNNVIATNVNVAKMFTAILGSSNPAQVSFSGGTIGGLTASGMVIQAILEGTTVNGSIVMKGGYQADVQMLDLVSVKNVTLTAPLPSIETTGTGSTINGNLTLTGTGWTSSSFGTTSVTEVKGNVTVTGGWFNDQFVANSNFKVGKSLTLNVKGGDNTIAIGDGVTAVTIGGNLKIVGGNGNDTISLDRVTLTGAVPLLGSTTILALGGTDLLSIEDGSSFAKTFTADMGAGNDTISIAQNTGAAAAVTFNGNAKILGGLGNDSLFLGIEPLTGDANTKVVFSGAINLVDGGAGLDFFDAASGQFTGVTPVNWT
jgi:hypothetical protein